MSSSGSRQILAPRNRADPQPDQHCWTSQQCHPMLDKPQCHPPQVVFGPKEAKREGIDIVVSDDSRSVVVVRGFHHVSSFGRGCQKVGLGAKAHSSARKLCGLVCGVWACSDLEHYRLIRCGVVVICELPKSGDGTRRHGCIRCRARRISPALRGYSRRGERRESPW